MYIVYTRCTCSQADSKMYCSIYKKRDKQTDLLILIVADKITTNLFSNFV